MTVVNFPARPCGCVLIVAAGAQRHLVFAPAAQPPKGFSTEAAALAYARALARDHRCAVDIRSADDATELVILPEAGGFALIVDEMGRITRLVHSRGPALPRDLAARIRAAVGWALHDFADDLAGSGDSSPPAA